MARNFFGFLAKNIPVQRFRKTNNIPGANWLITMFVRLILFTNKLLATNTFRCLLNGQYANYLILFTTHIVQIKSKFTIWTPGYKKKMDALFQNPGLHSAVHNNPRGYWLLDKKWVSVTGGNSLNRPLTWPTDSLPVEMGSYVCKHD